MTASLLCAFAHRELPWERVEFTAPCERTNRVSSSSPETASPHDVAPAPDGKVWYSAQRNGALGILDPATGQSREVKLGPKSSPHGVIQGPDGAAWLTDGGQNAIVRVDPDDRSGEGLETSPELRLREPEYWHVRP